jgi:hypothetical protein
LSGAYVQVSIEGRAHERVFRLPRQAIYEGNIAWVMDDADRLQRREISVAWGDAENVYVTAGVEPQERLVLTRMSNPIAGTKVAVVPATSDEPNQASTNDPAKPDPDAPAPAASATGSNGTQTKTEVN